MVGTEAHGVGWPQQWQPTGRMLRDRVGKVLGDEDLELEGLDSGIVAQSAIDDFRALQGVCCLPEEHGQ